MPKASTLATTSPETVSALRDVLGIDVIELAQTSGMIGYATKADMDGDLDHDEGALAKVTNDSTDANNGTYRKEGATGTGAWIQADDRVVTFKNDLAGTGADKGGELVGFLHGATDTIARTMQDKGRDIASVMDWMSDDERADARLETPLLDHTDAIAAAVTAMQGKTLHFPDGVYSLTATPSGIDGVHCTGSPRVSFTDVAIPLFMGTFTGNRETALVGGVIRYYATGDNGAGWYFLKDQGANHDPVLLGPITVSGIGSVVLEMNVADFGLDPDEWTPAGFVVGPDNVLALSGLIFGASVGSDTISIYGAYGTHRTAYINYNGSNWTGTNAPYTYAWTSGASAKLTVTRNTSVRECYTTGSLYPMLTPRVSAGGTPYLYVLDAAGAASFEVRVFDLAGNPVLTENTSMKFYVSDPIALPKAFDWSVAPATTSANIWMVGVFGRKGSTY